MRTNPRGFHQADGAGAVRSCLQSNSTHESGDSVKGNSTCPHGDVLSGRSEPVLRAHSSS